MTLVAREVHVEYRAGERHVLAVDGVSLTVGARERVGIIGESGCGKSSLFRALLGLETLSAGSVTWREQPTKSASPSLRREFQPVFQDVGAALNPRMRVREVLREPFEIHALECDDVRLTALLSTVGLGADVLPRLPRELSVGQRQRINLARALALEPKLLLLDEPVSALDVSVQAQILNLLADLARDRELALVVITHDLDVVAHVSDRVLVMLAGRVVEEGPTAEVLSSPRHPYTRSLVESRIRPVDARAPLAITGCAFSTRCAEATDACRSGRPALTGNSRLSACVVHLGS